MTTDEIENIIGLWLKEFHQKLEECNIKHEYLYNSDQTGMYYQNLPNNLYIDIEDEKNTRVCNHMKEKTRVTLMICTAANGDKTPIAIVGKPKNTVCFQKKMVLFPNHIKIMHGSIKS